MIILNCQDCIFGVKYKAIKIINSNTKNYECRINPPELTLKNQEEDVTAWPMVKALDFCGKAKV
jgi:hypothetical protein